ncbi:MAG: SDR family oxidoreductase [Anaerolineales bacterium]|nr:SDR family oxidoreductase [Anaerolineales bacterium]
MPPALSNLTAIVTGAGSGLGAAVAQALAAAGARCVLAGRRRAPLQALAAQLESAVGRALAVAADVTDEGQVAALVAAAVAEFGGVDIVVNNAGLLKQASVTATSLALWDEILNVNLRGAFLVCRAAWPHLCRSRGQIVNLSSMAAVQGFPDEAAYCASKAGLNGLTLALAAEGKPHGIRVLAVCPAATDTPLWESQAPAVVRDRMMKPEPIGELVSTLLAAPRSLDFDPVMIRNFADPWTAA